MTKESFGNAFAPFLVSHFDEVFVVDQRYFELNLTDFIREHGVTDMIFVNNIFAANTKIRIEELERIQNQTYVPYVPETPAPFRRNRTNRKKRTPIPSRRKSERLSRRARRNRRNLRISRKGAEECSTNTRRRAG